MSYIKAKVAIEKGNLREIDKALLEYIKEIEDRLQSTLEVNHLRDGS
jgi:hypothetical protein